MVVWNNWRNIKPVSSTNQGFINRLNGLYSLYILHATVKSETANANYTKGFE